MHPPARAAVWSGVANEDLRIDSLDAPLVAPGDPDHLLDYDGRTQPNLAGGMHFNLFNNLCTHEARGCASVLRRCRC